MAKVSVIIPVYNVEPYLKQCMDRVVGQTLKDIEIICVDDGSTDGSLDILKEYATEDSRIQIIEQKNAGAGAARNNGMRHATGKYLSFLDSDDFFEPRMLEKAYDLAEKDQADFVAYKSDQYHTEKKQFVSADWVIHENEIPPYHPFNHRQMTGNVFKVFVGWAWDKLFLKEFVDKYHLTFQEQRTSNDLLFVFSAVVLAKKISVVPNGSCSSATRCQGFSVKNKRVFLGLFLSCSDGTSGQTQRGGPVRRTGKRLYQLCTAFFTVELQHPVRTDKNKTERQAERRMVQRTRCRRKE